MPIFDLPQGIVLSRGGTLVPYLAWKIFTCDTCAFRPRCKFTVKPPHRIRANNFTRRAEMVMLADDNQARQIRPCW